MLARHLKATIQESLTDTPVVYVAGARQVGKTTLARQLVRSYLTLDDATSLGAARQDPSGFLAGLHTPVVIDEVQHVPELFPALKLEVEADRSPGRFLLTGSSNVLLVPRVAESLVGRMELHTLWPLSQGELAGVQETFLNRLMSKKPWKVGQSSPDLWARVLTGGFPEVALRRSSPSRRAAWFNAYLTTILQRDVRELANIEGLTELPRLMQLLAARSGHLMNQAELSRTSGLPASTLKRYLTLLEAVYLIRTVPAWSANLGKRIALSPKLMLVDSGLTSHLLGIDETRIKTDPNFGGSLLESFVANEILRQLSWSESRATLFHFRAHSGEEVDLVLETPDGMIVGIEVKASRTVSGSDWKGLRWLSERLGERFLRGVILYLGDQVVPSAAHLHAVPLPSLWS